MTEETSHDAGPAKGGWTSFVRPVLLAAGGLCVIAWAALIVVLVTGADIADSALTASIVLLALTLLAGAATLLSRSTIRWVAVGAALLHAAIFAYLRLGFDRMMPDAVLWAITIAYYLTPVASGLGAIIAGVRSDR